MDIVSTNMTVADYCAAMERGEIIVNKEYQRSDKVWPSIARAYLIETIILGYPIPKLSLYQKTDIKSKKTIKEIVDGQQRSMAIFEFWKGQSRLPRMLETEAIRDRTYSELAPDDQHRFLDFAISLDLFVAATREEVVEVFRRMNSYTVPLNAEEQRHATFQGTFKWFVNRVCKKFNQGLVDIGIFGEKQLVRMADTKLISEICDALMVGIRTTNKRILDRLYKDRDKAFPEEQEFQKRITDALDELRLWKDVHGTNIVKPYIVYSLLLAIIHVRKSVKSLEGIFKSPQIKKFDPKMVTENLLAISAALDDVDSNKDFEEFVKACTEKTNTKNQRTTRFVWLCRAITSPDFS